MRTIKIVASALALIILTTCSGGGHSNSPTEPKNITCLSDFNGIWIYSVESGCAHSIVAAGTRQGSLSTVNGCRLTLDITTSDQKAQGLSNVLVVAFDTGKATLERKGSICDGTDQGTIEEQFGHEFRLRFKGPQGTQCCSADYFVTLQY